MMKIIDIINESRTFGMVNEAGLARVLDRVQGNDFAIASAYRYGNSYKENQRRNNQLRQFLDGRRIGGYTLIGHWQEAPDGVEYQDASPEELTDSVEESILFVRPNEMPVEEFVNITVEIGKKFNQDAVIVALQEPREEFSIGNASIYLYFKDGNRQKIGSDLTLNKIGQAYSQLKNKPNIPFIFEGTLHPTNNIGKQLFHMKNILYVN